ncbi:MAG: NAD-glutamate dehydrogenase [Alphaproteobacteria bacterium]|nr:NAD-glutamate dehydrogenase [Alphaproteobacteria bacterium]
MNAARTASKKSQKESKSPTAKNAVKEASKPSKTGAEIKKVLSSHIPARDRTQFHDHDLSAIAESFSAFIHERKRGTPKLRVLNPSLKKDGYVSRHTVIMVANDDMPFLVDSTTGELNRMGLGIHLVVHPVVHIVRNERNQFEHFAGKTTSPDELSVESWMYIEIDETHEAAKLAEITANLERVLYNVRLAVRDWSAMRTKIMETITELPRNETVGLPVGEREETANFLAWLEADNFTFLGARDYHVSGTGKNMHLTTTQGSGLGILSDAVSVMFFGEEGEGSQPSDIHHFLERKQLALITKTYKQSVVHRTTPMDAILIKRYNAQGKLVGERLFVGLFTSSSYNRLAKDVPLIREKISYALDHAGLDPRSYNGKVFTHILNSYPRDELFQISAKELLETALGILDLQERQRLALFIRHDAFERFVNCLIYVPRDLYITKLRKEFQRILMKTFNGASSDFNVKITNESLAQIFIVVRTSKGQIPTYDRAKLEHELEDASRGWSGRLRNELVAAFGENRGLQLANTYADAFPDSYCETVNANESLKDLAFIEDVLKNNALELNLYRPAGGSAERIHLKWFSPNAPLSLSLILPMMQDMGLKTNAVLGPYEIKPAGATQSVWIQDCHAEVKPGISINLEQVKAKFEECLLKVWNKQVEADAYNQLILLADMNWREVVILRAIGKYLRQARLPYSEQAIIRTLSQHPKAARLLAQLFIARHNPELGKEGAKQSAKLEKDIAEYLKDVSMLEEDRILRRALNVIQNTLRTNYFQKDENGEPKSYLSFKLDSKKLDGLPLPRPHVEIFVYSPRTEAIHLRGGKVARGGIRWSDRREDFRTEVLGLMKAQQVKNTVIVPVGSKGGFVVKDPKPADMGKEGIACYQIMMRGLLDITDNRVGEKIVPPKNVVRHDEDDPYLVVAADKGTAKFSDIANALSIEYGFWLGDAFASGGSAGYDHKGMGITARGAWEGIKRHFREMGKDIQKEDFTVVGIGDMAGDVFGNGMLLSQHIRLVGAFNHKHIFIDPSPDSAKSFVERQRLFDLPGSQWSDYEKKLISKGGGVYNRDAKTIQLSKEARELFNIKSDSVTPDALMQAMLQAQVELLYFGGIGTYIKAEDENDADVGDRSNDACRVNAESVQAQVIGEGANLGMTQKARISYALRGGRLNTDAIDNSAGVDTSDHEVNIKILLAPAVASGKLSTKARNALLAKMTDDVAGLVLRDNHLQTLALTVTQARAAELLPIHARLMTALERKGLLNRKVEFLPNDEAIQERARLGKGLTRPELAVLMAYAKIDLYEEILASELPNNPALEGDLFIYFPKALQTEYANAIRTHRLRREIIATFTTNSLINRGGTHLIQLMQEKTGKSAAEIAGAYAVLRTVYGLRTTWNEIEKLEGKIDSKVTTELYTRLAKMIERATPWYVRHSTIASSEALIKKHGDAVVTLRKWMSERADEFITRDENEKRAADFRKAGVPSKIIDDILGLPVLAHIPEIVSLSEKTGRSLESVAELYFAVEQRFRIFWLRTQARDLSSENVWQREAATNLVDDLYDMQSVLTNLVLQANGKVSSGKVAPAAKGKKGAKASPASSAKAKPELLIENWVEPKADIARQYSVMLGEIAATRHADFAMLNLALRHLQQLAYKG